MQPVSPLLAAIVAGFVGAAAGALLPPILVLAALPLAALLALWAWFSRAASPPRSAPRPEPAGESGTGLPSAFGRALIEKLPAPLMLVSRTGRVAYANPAAHSALPRLQPGVHFANLIRAPAFVEAVGATLTDGDERSFQFTTHQGRERYFEARVGRLPSGGDFGPEAQAIVQIEDRTHHRRAEQLRSDFIANASHELRTPLSAIIGYIETLQNHAREDAQARETFLAVMAREAGRMQRLVDDLMALSRIEMSEHVRPDEECSLNAIAAESATTLLPLAKRHGVRLDIALAAQGAEVLGDRDQLQQVFVNLIDNALKYAGPGAEVRVFAAEPSRAHPNRFGVTVADTGPGIPREHIHRLTERFYRVSVRHSRNTGGTGLGLAIVKHILNRHEGRLEITSAPGEGSAFTVWLPHGADRAPGVPAAATQDRRSA